MGDDTTVPVLAKGKTDRGCGPMCVTIVRSVARAAGRDLLLLADRSGEHPERHLAGYSGILQADAIALQRALQAIASRVDHSSWIVGPMRALFVRACRRRLERSQR